MPSNEQTPRCKLCGNEMYVTRFRSTVTNAGIDHEYAYECLWCDNTDKVVSHVAHSQSAELTAAP